MIEWSISWHAWKGWALPQLIEGKLKSPIKITSLLTEKCKINWDRWLLSSLEFERGRYTILTNTPNLIPKLVLS